MLYYLIKVLISAAIIVAVTEVSKRSILLGSILASIPLVSVLGISWFYMDTKNISAVMELSKGIFWMVLPSLIFFITLPLLLRHKLSFTLSLTVALAIMIACYFVMIVALRYFGLRI